jgi:hypothetical protein
MHRPASGHRAFRRPSDAVTVRLRARGVLELELRPYRPSAPPSSRRIAACSRRASAEPLPRPPRRHRRQLRRRRAVPRGQPGIGAARQQRGHRCRAPRPHRPMQRRGAALVDPRSDPPPPRSTRRSPPPAPADPTAPTADCPPPQSATPSPPADSAPPRPPPPPPAAGSAPHRRRPPQNAAPCRRHRHGARARGRSAPRIPPAWRRLGGSPEPAPRGVDQPPGRRGVARREGVEEMA